MRFCLSGRQSREYLKKADEVLVLYRDRDFIYDLTKINPNAIITLALPGEEEIDWKLLTQYKIICRQGFRVACQKIDNLITAKEKGFDFFSLIPARYGYELQALLNFGVCAVRISGELIHHLNYIDKINTEIRVIANSPDTFLNHSIITGSWIRPEDLIQFTQIDVCEFQSINITQEQALYRIYAEHKQWRGYLYEIINGITDKDIINRLIPPEFAIQRANCRQSCMNGGGCHYCLRVLNMAKIESIREITFEEKENQNNDNNI